jgi:S1-C subfamily serine protease
MKNKGLIFVAALALVHPAFGQAPEGEAQSAAPAISAQTQDLDKSVVLIRSVRQSFNYLTPWKQEQPEHGIASGFVIDGNRILTNAHIVSNARYIEVQKENVAKRFLAAVAFAGHDCDLAVLSVADPAFFDDTIPLDFAALPKVNSTVSTYGFPLGGTRISVTEGVVSRIEMDVYAHSGADAHLVIQTDAAINPGNSGGPVMQDGKVVGVAFQGVRQAENIGYLIPTTVIKHFLADIEDGLYHGFGSLDATLFAGLHNPAFKSYLNVPPNEDGAVVINTWMHGSLESILKPNDVLTYIDDYDVDNDGMVRIYGLRLHLAEVIETKQVGDSFKLTFHRDGKQLTETAAVVIARPVLDPARLYDNPSRYVAFAGLIFVPVSRNYLEVWGRDWPTRIPYYLRYLLHNSMQLNTDRDRKEYVVISEIMPDQINSYAEQFKHSPLAEINGITVHSLDDVLLVLEKSDLDFHILKFMDAEFPLVIDAKTARLRQQQILDRYQIPARTAPLGINSENQL